MQQHAERMEDAQVLPAIRQPGRARRVVLAFLVLAFIAVWWQGENWLGPPSPPPATNTQLETALRMGMYLQAQRIKAFRIRTGRLPVNLEEAGPPVPTVVYRKLDDDTYEITGQNGSVTLTYRSDQPLAQLIGDAASRLGLEE